MIIRGNKKIPSDPGPINLKMCKGSRRFFMFPWRLCTSKSVFLYQINNNQQINYAFTLYVSLHLPSHIVRVILSHQRMAKYKICIKASCVPQTCISVLQRYYICVSLVVSSRQIQSARKGKSKWNYEKDWKNEINQLWIKVPKFIKIYFADWLSLTLPNMCTSLDYIIVYLQVTWVWWSG